MSFYVGRALVGALFVISTFILNTASAEADTTKPTVTGVSWKDIDGNQPTYLKEKDEFTVTITFDKAMNTSTPPALAFYDEEGGADGDGTEFVIPSNWDGVGSWSDGDTIYSVKYELPSFDGVASIASVEVSNATDTFSNELDKDTKNFNPKINIDDLWPDVVDVWTSSSTHAPDDKFTIWVKFSEVMNISITPRLIFYGVPVDDIGHTTVGLDISGLLTSTVLGWQDGGKTWGIQYAVSATLAADVSIVSVEVADAVDLAGNNLNESYFDISITADPSASTAPTVVSASTDNSNPAPGKKFTLSVVFSEAMDTGAAATPTLTLNAVDGDDSEVDISGWTSTNLGWQSGDETWKVEYEVPATLESSVTIASVTVTNPTSVTDEAGHALDTTNDGDTATVLISVTENTAPTKAAQVSKAFVDKTLVGLNGTFTVSVEFNGAMKDDPDPANDPTLAFYDSNIIEVATFLSAGTGNWTDVDGDGGLETWNITYTVPSDSTSVSIASVRVTNPDDVKDTADKALNESHVTAVFDPEIDIDAVRPQIASVDWVNAVTNDKSPVGPGEVFTMTVVFSEAMRDDTIPRVTIYNADGKKLRRLNDVPAEDSNGRVYDTRSEEGLGWQDVDGDGYSKIWKFRYVPWDEHKTGEVVDTFKIGNESVKE